MYVVQTSKDSQFEKTGGRLSVGRWKDPEARQYCGRMSGKQEATKGGMLIGFYVGIQVYRGILIGENGSMSGKQKITRGGIMIGLYVGMR